LCIVSVIRLMRAQINTQKTKNPEPNNTSYLQHV
jgi:hypothetical protein